MLHEHLPEVILLDIGMRGLDGYETCKRIRRALGDGVLIVALTGFGQEQDKEEATRAGFDAHLTKPADKAALATILAYPASDRNASRADAGIGIAHEAFPVFDSSSKSRLPSVNTRL